MTDTVADMITRIKNAYMARHSDVTMPASKQRESIAKILAETGYIVEFVREEQKPQDVLKLTLRYVKGKPALTDVKRISSPGRRVYEPADKLPRVLGGYGISVISTSQGVMTDKTAREKGLGGEVMFKMW